MSVQTMLPIHRLRQTNCFDDSPAALRRVWPRQSSPASISVLGITRDIRVKIASTREEWEQAFQLVADNYQARGYDAGDCDYRFTSYHALPDSVVLVAESGGRVVATFSLVADNTLLGLPMEALYPGEIRELRQAGRRLFETGSLADRDLSTREFVQVFFALMRLGWQYQVSGGANTTVIAINPRHRAFYAKMLGFSPLGPRRAYASVRHHPAEAYFVDPALMRVTVPDVYRQMFGEPLPRQALVAARMPSSLVRHFARHSSQTDPRLVEEILDYVDAYGSPKRWR